MKFNTKFINIISCFFSVIIVCFVSLGLNHIQTNFENENKKNLELIESRAKNKTKNEVFTQDKNSGNEVFTNDGSLESKTLAQDESQENEGETKEEFDWYIEIPKIEVYAPIEEGTGEEILNRSVGHFENTSRRNGNCGLAAHNRGYSVNYFARLKELEKGDLIYYFVDGKKYKYKIDNILIIYETDWSMLEETEEDKITLITCVENRPEYRLCVQGSLSES